LLANLSLADVFDAFSSPAPTPGGGSAAALAGALGASLLAMVAALPKTKNNTPEERASLDAARARILELRSRLVELIDRDAAAYDAVVAAYQRPRATAAEKSARKAAIQDALKLATNVPLETCLAIHDAYLEAGVVAEAGNPSARSDFAVATQLLMTGAQGALLNVETNLGSVTDPEFVAGVVQRVNASHAQIRPAITRGFEAAGVSDLFRQIAARFDLGHGHAPPGREVWIKGAAHSLRMLGSSDARAALSLLAQSADAETARAAKTALASFTAPG
jgi:formiminotetrahydrofolate cyclodeaminase